MFPIPSRNMLLSRTGIIYTRGKNKCGELGCGDKNPRSEFVKASEIRFKNISVGDFCTFAVDIQGSLWVCGDNSEYGSGLSLVPDSVPTLTRIQGLPQMISVSTSSNFTVMIDEQHKCWWFGPKCVSDTKDFIFRPEPTIIPNITNINQVTTGNLHCLMLTDIGSVYSFGKNGSGQLGLGDALPRIYPTHITGLDCIITSIASGQSHNLCLSESAIYSFGCNLSGKLGIGNDTMKASWSPLQVQLPKNLKFSSIAANGYCSVFQDSDGCVWLSGAVCKSLFGGCDDCYSVSGSLNIISGCGQECHYCPLKCGLLTGKEILVDSLGLFVVDTDGNVSACNCTRWDYDYSVPCEFSIIPELNLHRTSFGLKSAANVSFSSQSLV